MTSIKLKYRAAAVQGKEGSLYFQVIHERVVRQISTGFTLQPQEWDPIQECIRLPSFSSASRYFQLLVVRDETAAIQQRLQRLVRQMETEKTAFTADELVAAYQQKQAVQSSFTGYMRRCISMLEANGKKGCARAYRQALNSVMKYRNDMDILFDDFTSVFVEGYEAWLQSHDVCRNTTSFYLRILRAVYHKAVEEGWAMPPVSFRRVYTGVDRTVKRAVSPTGIKRIKNLDLTASPCLAFARDMFLLSFYLRGISFIDLAFLRKTDLANGVITYVRRKTHRSLSIFVEQKIQDLLDRYPNTTSRYLLPLLLCEDGTEMKQYQNQLNRINRLLKTVGQLAGIPTPLSLYVARHSWASMAQMHHIPISIICGALGHDNEMTTQIYLSSIQRTEIDKANRKILREI